MRGIEDDEANNMTAAGTEREVADRDRGYWERHARNYDASLRILSKPLPRMLALVTEAASGVDRVLEVAAGTGLVTTALATVARHVTATDYTDAMVAMLQQRTAASGLTNVSCEKADIYALPYEPASFDVVVAANVLHLLPDLSTALTALTRVLRPAGKLLVPTFCHDQTLLSAVVSRLLSLTGFPGHRRLTSTSLQALLEHHGLRVGRQEVIGGLIPIVYAEATASAA